MAFSKQVVAKVKNEYFDKYARAQAAADARRAELHSKIDGLAIVDRELGKTGVRIMDATMSGIDVAKKIADIKKENENILAVRAELLRAHGYPEDYTDVRYECEKCGDSGYIDTVMCDCMKRALVRESYAASGLAGLIDTQSFENFSLDYYKQTAAVYSNMKLALHITREFAENFSANTYKNFLFMGGTGLGKTHLSTAIAKTVMDRSFDVLYVTATGMMGDFEYKRFGNTAFDGDAGDTSRYYTADLLIIDDLGTEMTNQFTISCLYDVINARIIARKSTIISTNLGKDEIVKRYWDRITSRMFGEYLPVVFAGTDIRRQKISK